MRKLKRFSRCFLALALCIISMCGMSVTAFAYSDPDASTTETVQDAAVPETTDTEANPFTPDGNASILDEADSDQNKYFYTIQTANDNVFYMIIDKDRAAGNVYLLSMIDENDLMEFVTEEESEPDNEGAIPDAFQNPTEPEKTEPATEPNEDDETEPDAADPPTNTSNGTVTLIALGVLAVIFLIGYYIVKIRNKDDTEDEEDETSHGMEETEEEDDADESELMEEEETDTAPFNEDYPDPADYPDEETV